VTERGTCARLDPVRAQFVHQLAEQERIAAGRVVAGGREGRVGRTLEAPGDVALDTVAAERLRPHDAGVRIGGDRRQRAGLRVGVVQPGRERQQHRQLVEAVHQEAQPVERRVVGPVDVVDSHEQRGLVRQPRGEPEEAVEHGEERFAARDRDGRISDVHECRGDGGRAREQSRTLRRRDRRHHRLEQLPHHSEAEPALELAAARGQHAHAAPGGALAQRTQEPGLADARGPLEHEDPAAPRAGGGDRRVTGGQLGVALDQRLVIGAGRARRSGAPHESAYPRADDNPGAARTSERGQRRGLTTRIISVLDR
jgi:hypothetical protein